MDALQAIVLGIVQGLTEFLPISSSAHLRFVPAMAGWEDPGAAFTAVVQLGTLAAVLLYFRRDLLAITGGWVRGVRRPAARGTAEWRMGWYLIIGTVPIVILGVALRNPIENEFRTLELIGVVLIVLAIVLAWADRVGSHEREIDSIGPRDAAVIGLAQAAALLPGVSRSGATISAGLFLGLDRAAAARFSFLLSVPAIVLSGAFELRHIGEGGAPLFETALATVLAFAAGYASIAWLLRFLVRHTLAVFVGYRLIVGALVVALAATNTIV